MKTKLLVVVKTYPTLTTNYEESVCTAGITENSDWIRIYPVPFRKLSYSKQYKKYEWIEIDIVKNSSDFRPESFRPVTLDTDITILDFIDTKNKWQKRKDLVLKNIWTRYIFINRLLVLCNYFAEIVNLNLLPFPNSVWR